MNDESIINEVAKKVGLHSLVSDSLNERERVCLIEEQITLAMNKYAEFMDIVLPNWRNDVNSIDTPKRVAKMFIKELFAGLYLSSPKITVFDNINEGAYTGIVFQGGIDVKSVCSHHHMPFYGKAYVAYIPTDGEASKIIGLSKLNRLVDFVSRRPQVQEALTTQIHDILVNLLGEVRGVAVHIEAEHTCVSHRGVNQQSTMRTSKLSGLFFDNHLGTRDEFYNFVSNHKK